MNWFVQTKGVATDKRKKIATKLSIMTYNKGLPHPLGSAKKETINMKKHTDLSAVIIENLKCGGHLEPRDSFYKTNTISDRMA